MCKQIFNFNIRIPLRTHVIYIRILYFNIFIDFVPRSSERSLSHFQKHSSPSSTSCQTSSQTSILMSATSAAGASKSKKKDVSPSPSNLLERQESNIGGHCSIAIPITSSFTKPSNKQGFRFSLRRMLYNSPLVSQRRTRCQSASNNQNLPSENAGSGSKKNRHQQQPFAMIQSLHLIRRPVPSRRSVRPAGRQNA